jgi:hypothetical protein
MSLVLSLSARIFQAPAATSASRQSPVASRQSRVAMDAELAERLHRDPLLM